MSEKIMSTKIINCSRCGKIIGEEDSIKGPIYNDSISLYITNRKYTHVHAYSEKEILPASYSGIKIPGYCTHHINITTDSASVIELAFCEECSKKVLKLITNEDVYKIIENSNLF